MKRILKRYLAILLVFVLALQVIDVNVLAENDTVISAQSEAETTEKKEAEVKAEEKTTEIKQSEEKKQESSESKKEEKADLRVLFKNAKSAKKVMLAQSSIAESYCRHDLIVGGDIALGMTLVRAINRTEKYLFPHFMTKRYLNKIKKQTCSLNVYGKIFFTKLSQPSK